MSAVASGATYIIVDEQNAPRYSSCEDITLAFFPLAYSDSAQSIAAATSTKVWRVRGWKYMDVIGWYPKLLAVKKIDGKCHQALPFG